MRLKHTAIFAAIGVILTIFPVLLNFFIPFTKAILLCSLISIVGNILIFIFFYMFSIVREGASPLKTAGVLGLMGYLIIIILDITGMIFNGLFYIAVKYSLKYAGLLNITFMYNRASFIISLIPIVLILMCFIFLHKNLDNNSTLKKAAFLVTIGQIISLVNWFLSLILNMFLFNILYQRVGAGGLDIINSVESIIGLIQPVLLFIFFIVFYRELNSNENNIQLQHWLI